MEQYLYRLQLKPLLLDETNWTERENDIVNRHFNRLKKLTEEGTVLLAGRTLNNDETQFGIVILEVESEDGARRIMVEDPAISEGIMEGELFPYHVALMR